MNWREKDLRFSIRKLKVAVASIIVGLSGLGVMVPNPVVQAQETVQVTSYQDVKYRYVLESELTETEKSQIKRYLPSHQAGDYKTYYMVYRPAKSLPHTGSGQDLAVTLLGTGLLLIGTAAIKDKKKRLITSITLLILGGAGSVSALPNESVLSVYDEGYSLQVGSVIPETAIAIPNYEFVGYLLIDADQPVKEIVEEAEQASPEEESPQIIQAASVQPSSATVTAPVLREEIEDVAFDVLYQEDPNSPVGTETLIQEGQLGQKRKSYADGVLVSEELIVAPVPRIIAKGTKAVVTQPSGPVRGTETVVETETIAHGSRTVEDPDQYTDYNNEVPGTDGQAEVTKVYQTEDGERVGDPTITRRTLVEAVDTVITVGTKPINSTEVTTETVAIDYDVLEETDANEYTDYESVRVEGEAGSKTVTTTYDTVKGVRQPDPEVTETITKQPVDKVVVKGTKPINGTEVTTETIAIDYDVLEETDANEYTDYESVRVEGEAGSKTVTTTYDTVKGVRQPDPEVTETITKQPVDKIVVKGTKPINGTEVTTETVAIDYDVLEETDANEYTDYESVRVEGEAGSKTITTTYETIKGVRQPDPEVTETITKQPVDKVVVKGTKPINGTETDVETVVIPFKEEIQFDNTKLATDEDEVLQEGKNGSKTITKIYNTVRGQRVGDPVSETEDIILEAHNRIIKRGTLVQTEAEKQTPTAIRQTVLINQEPVAENSIDTSKLTKVKTYTWKDGNKPSTAIKAQEVPGIVVVTYDDDSIDEVAVEIEVAENKTKPTLVLETLTEKDDDRKIVLDYKLTDETQAYTGATIQIYDGLKLVKALELNNQFEPFDVDGLDWDVPYTLKTTLKYDLGNGQQTEPLEDKSFELEYKKLEIKDVDSLSLYRLDNGNFSRVNLLSEAPNDPENYFVRVSSDRFRDMLLPVKTIVSEDLPTGGSAYRVTTDLQELVEDKDPSVQSRYEEQFSFLVKKTPENPTAITSFKGLLDAIKANLSGNFVIGADLFADEVAVGANDLAYITNEFRGTITGLSDGQQHAIYNLKVPLFNRLTGATVSNLDLKNVAINTTRSGIGTVANEAFGGSRLTDISVQGSVRAERNVAGLVNNIVESTLTNTSFTGGLTMAATTGSAAMGGIASYLTRGTIQNSYVNADMTVTANSNDIRVGGIIGFSNNGVAGGSFRGQNVSNVYTEGTLTNNGSQGQIGGIIGSNEHGSFPGRVQNAINNMTVTNGKPIYGFTNIRSGSITEAYTTTGEAQAQTGLLTKEEAETRQENMGITTSLSDSGIFTDSFKFTTDYTILPKATAERKIAYENIEKLLPFYNKEQIVKYGNLVDTSSKLYETKLLSVTPMKGDEVISDVNSVKDNLNRLMLHYEDGTVAYLDIAYKEDFRNKAVSEYTIKDTDLIYTPEQFLSNYDGLVASLQSSLESVTYNSVDMVRAIGSYSQTDLLNAMIARAQAQVGGVSGYIIRSKSDLFTVLRQRRDHAATTALMQQLEEDSIRDFNENMGTITNQMARLYLEPTFDQVKANIPSLLRQVLATDKSVNTTGGIIDRYLEDYIQTNKEKLLMGLAYVTRWYNIDFQGTNIKNLATFHQDFYGKPVNTLEWLVQLGSSYELLSPPNNLTTYASQMAPNTNKADLLEYLTANRELFTTYGDDNTWFKNTTKAYIAEQQSEEVTNRVLKVYETLSMESQRNGILPLLTAQEGIFIINTLGGLTYGMFDRYYDTGTLRNLPRDQQIEKIKAMVDLTAKRHGEHFDVWYRIAPTNVRDALIKPAMVTWDGYMVGNKWTPMFGSEATQATRDFFGPVGGRSGVANNGSGAYADGTSTKYVTARVLDDYGSSVYTHEVVHNNDGEVYLGGFGRRQGLGPEAFALGFLQSSSYGGHAAGFITLNLIMDYTAQANALNRDTNVTPDRFQDASDLKEYMHGVFDVLYTLDYAEALAATQLTDEQKINHYAVIENVMAGVHAGNKIRALTADEAAQLTDWEKFLEGNIIGRREYGLQTYNRNGYHHSYLFTPNYAALSNPTGAPGDLMFRRIAFELMADKGYEEGFIPYTSNKLKPAGADLTDDIVLSGIYGTTYPTWLDFKKAMFKERIDKLGQLTSTTITYQGRQETITSFADIERLMTAAMTYDVTNRIATTTRNSRVHELKRAIYNAYLRQTNDFENSIFN